MDKGYIHLYTGNGKGKTTAAFGLAVRALMAGKKVYIGQFIKGMEYSEYKLKDHLENLTIELLGKDCFIERAPGEEDIRLAKEGLERCGQILQEGNYDLVILDELTIALYFKLFTVEELMKTLEKKKIQTELVITGRYAPDELIDVADLVTEMKEVKHYYSQGVLSREGIDC